MVEFGCPILKANYAQLFLRNEVSQEIANEEEREKKIFALDPTSKG